MTKKELKKELIETLIESANTYLDSTEFRYNFWQETFESVSESGDTLLDLLAKWLNEEFQKLQEQVINQVMNAVEEHARQIEDKLIEKTKAKLMKDVAEKDEYGLYQWIDWWRDAWGEEHLDQAVTWYKAGWIFPSEARAWYDAGWGPSEAIEWRRAGWIDPAEARKYYETGQRDPEKAKLHKQDKKVA